MDDFVGSTPGPEPSPPSPGCVEQKPEPTATEEPSHPGVTELRIAVEPELHVTSDQVQKLATTPATRERVVAS